VFSCKEVSTTALNGMKADNFTELSSKAWIGRESMNYATYKKCYTLEMDTHLNRIQDAIRGHNLAREQNFFYALMSF